MQLGEVGLRLEIGNRVYPLPVLVPHDFLDLSRRWSEVSFLRINISPVLLCILRGTVPVKNEKKCSLPGNLSLTLIPLLVSPCVVYSAG